MKLASFLSAAAVLGTATMASAVVNVIVTQNGAIGSVDDPGVAGSQNLTSYTIAFDNTGVANIGGFDFQVQGTGIYQIQGNGFGNVAQDSLYSDTLSAGGAAYVNADTHLLFTAAQLVAESLPTEGNEGVSLGGDSAHHGSSTFFDSGATGINGAFQANQVNVLQLILAPGGSVTLSGLVAVQGETEPQNLPTTQIPNVIPEPTSLALLGLGGLALVRRRMA
jgi:hypothetical protein